MKHICLFDQELTNAARRVFGNILLQAYSCSLFLGQSEPLESDFAEIILYKDDSEDVDNGSKDICLVFSNGNKVLLTNSEWGSIERVRSNEIFFADKTNINAGETERIIHAH